MKILTTVLFLLLAAMAVQADHEPDHRYEVQGYLLDADRNPLPAVGISISSGNQILANTSSDSDGFYYLKLHLHDSSIGRKLKISTADYADTIVMTASVGDKTTRRLHYANFIDGKLVEGQLEGMSDSRWKYYTGTALILLVIAVAIITGLKKYRKRHRRQAQTAARGQHRRKRKRRR